MKHLMKKNYLIEKNINGGNVLNKNLLGKYFCMQI